MAKKGSDALSIEYNLAAPCGMYCGGCRQFLEREKGFKKGCEGCRVRHKNCAFIRRDCLPIRDGTFLFCFECGHFPCDNLKRMEKKYNEKYGVSWVKNLERIRQVGPDAWLAEQHEAWTCPECGGRLCLHDAKCYDCGAPLKK